MNSKQFAIHALLEFHKIDGKFTHKDEIKQTY